MADCCGKLLRNSSSDRACRFSAAWKSRLGESCRSAVQITGTHDIKKSPEYLVAAQRQESEKESGDYSETGRICECQKEVWNKKL
jgi:hypothetical protein